MYVLDTNTLVHFFKGIGNVSASLLSKPPRTIAIPTIVLFELENRGTPIGPYDVLIAGTALANRSVLVTHNTREFERIEGLRLEDWY